MSETTKRPVATIIDEIEYPIMFIEGLVITANFQVNGKRFGRTVSIADNAPDEAIRYAIRKFADEIIKVRSSL